MTEQSRQERFTKLTHRLIDGGLIARIGASAFAVYVVLMRHADGDGRCYPSVSRIATQTGLGEKTVQRAVRRLESLGIIRVERTNGTHNRYEVNRDDRGQYGTGLIGTGVKMKLVPGSKRPGHRGQNDLLRIPIEEDPMKKIAQSVGRARSGRRPKKNKSKTSDKSTNGYHEPFLKFWQTYPRKVAKRAARKAYDAAVKRLKADRGISMDECHDVLRESAQCYGATVDDLQFVKYPATWLNGDCWDDEPTPATASTVATIGPPPPPR